MQDLKIAFNEQLPEQKSPRGFQVELAPPLVHGLVQLLEQALAQSAWTQVSEVQEDLSQANGMPSPEDRPKYLN